MMDLFSEEWQSTSFEGSLRQIMLGQMILVGLQLECVEDGLSSEAMLEA